MLQVKDEDYQTTFKKLYTAYQRYIQNKRCRRVESKSNEKVYYVTTNEKKAKMVIMVSDKVDNKAKIITNHEEKQFLKIKGSFHSEYAINVNLCGNVRKNMPIIIGALRFLSETYNTKISNNTNI